MNQPSESRPDREAFSAAATPVSYVESRRRLFGRFSDGSLVAVERNRARSYPGLASESPPTAPIYEVAACELAGQEPWSISGVARV